MCNQVRGLLQKLNHNDKMLLQVPHNLIIFLSHQVEAMCRRVTQPVYQ